MKSHIFPLYATQDKAVARINVLRKQLGKPPLTIADDDVLHIETLWTEIEELEAATPVATETKPKVEASAPKEQAPKVLAPEARTVVPHQSLRHYSLSADHKPFIIDGQRPAGTFGLQRAIAANSKSKK